MARRGRVRNRTRRTAASAFASGEVGGKSTGWESIFNQDIPQTLTAAFPTTAQISGADTNRFVTLVPVNVTRGTVTMMRVRGQMAVFFELASLASTENDWRVNVMLQLAPARDGSVLTDSVLSAANAADLESNRILWRHTFWPETTDAATFDINPVAFSKGIDIDIKSKRRWDRANWALVLSVVSLTTSQIEHFIGGNMRAYFKAGDAL